MYASHGLAPRPLGSASLLKGESVGSTQGVRCRPQTEGGESHFVCDGCLEGHAAAETSLELRVRRERQGRVRCPHASLGCDAPCFADGELARVLSEAAFARYVTARVELLELAAAEQVRAGAGAAAGPAGVNGNGGGGGGGDGHPDDEVEQARRHVEERILNTSCPRCGTVFLEFDGCAALRCRACPCAFCAWCLQVRAGRNPPSPTLCSVSRTASAAWYSVYPSTPIPAQSGVRWVSAILGASLTQTRFVARCLLQDCGRDAHTHVGVCAHKPAHSDEYFPNVAELRAAQLQVSTEAGPGLTL
jgi:hypothetical protein